MRAENPLSQQSPIKSPCLRLCAVDGRANICRGCGRTLKEIAGWSAMSDAERDIVLRDLPRRIGTLGFKATSPDEALAKIRDALDT
jgi:predicted Fe-S protein YdhL (DUF1289 family)